MAKDKKPSERFEATQQIRVRAKNPQIGRKRSDVPLEDATQQAEIEDLAALAPRPRIEPMDDDATEILGGPPPVSFDRPAVVVRADAGASVLRSTVPRERAETALDRGPTRRLVPPDEAPTARPAPEESGSTRLRREAEATPARALREEDDRRRAARAQPDERRIPDERRAPDERARPRDERRVRDDEAPTTRPTRDDDRRPTPRDRAPFELRRAPAVEDGPTERPAARTARPRGHMEPLGTEGAGLLAQKAKIARAEARMPGVQHPSLKPYRGVLDDRALSALDRVLAGELDSRDVEAQASPKRALERVVFSPELERLALDERAALLRAVAAQPRELDTMRATARILERAPWKRLSAQERLMLAELLGTLAPRQCALLADLVERNLHGKSALEDRDLADTTLLSQLLGLARERQVASRIESAGLDLPRALDLILHAVAHPHGLPLEDGPDGVLGSLEVALADVSPAEYARLWRALCTGDSSAALAGAGSLDLADTLRSRAGTRFVGHETPLRVGLETLVGLAHPRSGPNRSGLLMPGGHGIDADVTARVLGHVYGVGFTVAAGATAAVRHLERLEGDAQRVPPAFVTLLYEGGERLFVFDHFADERAYFRASHGESTKPRGTRRPDPLRVVEDPALGLESVSMAELAQIIGVALIPRT